MLIWAFVIICMIISIINVIKECGKGKKFSCYIGCFLTYFCALSVVAGMIYFFIWAIGSTCGQTKTELVEKNYNIYGLQFDRQSQTYSEGTFILGCGGYSSGSKTTNTYYFFSENEYGRKMESLDNSQLDVYIKETDSEEPHLKTIYTIFNYAPFWKTFLGVSPLITKIESGKILVVPTNTIKIDYNVNI